MALVVKDRVRETSTTTGTGTFTLAGAVTGYQAFSAVGNGNTTYYTIYLQGGNEWEVGIGTYTASGTTLSRDTILASSNGGSAVNFSAGTKDVFVTYPAGRSVWYDSATNVTLNALTLSGGTANGVAYLNGSKVLTTGSALTFDGAALKNTGAIVSGAFGAAGVFTLNRSSDGNGIAVFESLAGTNNVGLRNAQGDILFSAAGSEQMRLTSTGLGIGTSSPSQKLTVSGSANLAGRGNTFAFMTPDWRMYNSSSGNALVWDNYTTEYMRLDSSGNLGLGVTPKTDWSANYDAFQLGGGSSLSGHTSTSLNFTVLASNQYINTAGASKFINDGYAPRYLQRGDTGEHYWYTTNSGLAGGNVTNIQAMTLDASGNLGIGSTTINVGSYGRVITVAATAAAYGAVEVSGTTGGAIDFQTSQSTRQVQLLGNSNGFVMLTNGGAGLAERARISSDGTFRVKGAGTAGTTDAVQFSGSAPANSLILDSSGVLKENGYAVVSQADIGTAPNEVPLNQYLGTMAYQDGTNYYNTGMTVGFRNRIINGAMQIDQRNAGASVTPTVNGTYLLDRWQYGQNSATGKFSVQQSSTAPSGFTNSILFTSNSAYSLGSSDVQIVGQSIEGLNCADLAWGTSSAKSITISFWARSSLTGNFGAVVRNADDTRCYPFLYTINSANTWEYKTTVVSGDTTGTWNTNTSIGIRLAFQIGTGSTYSGPPGAWAGTAYYGAAGAVNVTGTNGATLYITGVQFEVGTQATPFDWRPYTTELQLCQRYYQVISYFLGYLTSSTGTRQGVPVAVALRAAPTVTVAATANSISNPNGTNGTPSTISNTTYHATSTTVWFDMASSTTMTPAVVGSGCLTTAVGSFSSEL